MRRARIIGVQVAIAVVLFHDFLHYTNDGSVVVGDTVFRELCPDLVKRFRLPASCPAAAL